MSNKILCDNLLSQDAFWTVNKKLASILGIECTVLLAELIFKRKQITLDKRIEHEELYYFYFNSNEIKEKTYISWDRQKKFFDKMEKLGLIKTVKKGLPATKYFYIDDTSIIKLLNQESVKHGNLNQNFTDVYINKKEYNKKEFNKVSKDTIRTDKLSYNYENNDSAIGRESRIKKKNLFIIKSEREVRFLRLLQSLLNEYQDTNIFTIHKFPAKIEIGTEINKTLKETILLLMNIQSGLFTTNNYQFKETILKNYDVNKMFKEEINFGKLRKLLRKSIDNFIELRKHGNGFFKFDLKKKISLKDFIFNFKTQYSFFIYCLNEEIKAPIKVIQSKNYDKISDEIWGKYNALIVYAGIEFTLIEKERFKNNIYKIYQFWLDYTNRFKNWFRYSSTYMYMCKFEQFVECHLRFLETNFSSYKPGHFSQDKETWKLFEQYMLKNHDIYLDIEKAEKAMREQIRYNIIYEINEWNELAASNTMKEVSSIEAEIGALNKDERQKVLTEQRDMLRPKYFDSIKEMLDILGLTLEDAKKKTIVLDWI